MCIKKASDLRIERPALRRTGHRRNRVGGMWRSVLTKDKAQFWAGNYAIAGK